VQGRSQDIGGDLLDSIYDITIVGGGPTGLFGLFYAGMREMSAKVIDSLEELGGQLTALYPEKFIYDMPGFPQVKSKDLVAQMVEQGLQYGATVCLGEKVQRLEQQDGIWRLETHRSAAHLSRTVVITVGAGGFAPRKLALPRVEEFEGRGVYYFVKDLEPFTGKRVLIVGGGDSALDWALSLEPIARSVTLIHRRDKFRAHESSVNQLRASSCEVCLFWELEAIHGDGRVQGATIIENRSQERRTLAVDVIIFSLGFVADIGPIRHWGLELEGGAIKVNSRMETNLPGIYAAGDIVTYDGKLKLIATGVGEAAIAVNHAKTFIDPRARAFPGHSSDMVK
jgi:ferredoxin/flavodoxin---NADP+ reductase